MAIIFSRQVIKEAPEIATAASSDERSTVEASNLSTIPITRQLRTDRGWQITTCFRVSQFATSVFEDEFFREQLAAAKATKLQPFDQPDSPGVFLQLPLDQRVNRARYRCIKVQHATEERRVPQPCLPLRFGWPRGTCALLHAARNV